MMPEAPATCPFHLSQSPEQQVLSPYPFSWMGRPRHRGVASLAKGYTAEM